MLSGMHRAYVASVGLVSSAFIGLLASCGTDAGVTPTDAGPTPTTSASVPGPTGQGLPCDVQRVLADNCWKCHSSPPKFGAPMPLTTHAQLIAAATSDATKKVHERVVKRIHDDAAYHACGDG